MSKDEFLRGLETALAGEVPEAVIRDNVNYYDSYISQEMANGRTVNEIVAEIGDPRIVAKTITEHAEAVSEAGGNSGSGNYGSGDYDSSGAGRETPNRRSGIHYFDLNKWYWKLLLLVIGFLIITVVFRIVGGIIAIIGGIFGLVMKFASPLLVILLLIWFIKGLRR